MKLSTGSNMVYFGRFRRVIFGFGIPMCAKWSLVGAQLFTHNLHPTCNNANATYVQFALTIGIAPPFHVLIPHKKREEGGVKIVHGTGASLYADLRALRKQLLRIHIVSSSLRLDKWRKRGRL